MKKLETICDMIYIAVGIPLLCYNLYDLYHSNSLHFCIKHSETTSIAEIQRTIVKDIREISPKCIIQFNKTQYNDKFVEIRVDHMTRKEQIQLKSVIPYWNNVIVI